MAPTNDAAQYSRPGKLDKERMRKRTEKRQRRTELRWLPGGRWFLLLPILRLVHRFPIVPSYRISSRPPRRIVVLPRFYHHCYYNFVEAR